MLTIRFVTGNDIVSNGIRDFEYGFWATHAEALMPDGTLLGAHAKGGVQARPHDYDNGTFTREEYVTILATPAETDAFHSFLRSQIGKPYDFKAVAGIALGRDWQSPDAWFCSELQGAGLVNVGKISKSLASEMNHFTPRDLLLIASGSMQLAV